MTRRRKVAPVPTASAWSTVAPWVLLVIVVLLTAAARFRLADVPLERDEGEYAYAGQLILQGEAPYSLAYNMKFPGAYYAYALILAVFGETARGIHLGLLVVHAATTVLLFLMGRRWIGALAAVLAAAVFSTLALDRWTMAIFAHATHFVLLPALAGFFILSGVRGAPGRLRCAMAGVLFGLAVLMKQPAVAYGLAAAAWVAWQCVRESTDRRSWWQAVAALAGGAAVPFVAMVILFAAHGVLGRFWFWTFQYAAQYATEVPRSEAVLLFQLSWGEITKATGTMWILAGVGVAALWIGRWPGETRAFMAMLALASAAAIVPGFYFRQHYFILILPVVALLAAVAATAIGRAVARLSVPALGPVVSVAVIAAAIASYLSTEREYLFRMAPAEISRSVYSMNPFVEAPEIARYLRAHTTPSDRIAVIGSEPEIYFHAGRRSATGYIYTYALMEPQPYAARMQEEMIKEVEEARPRYLVSVLINASWLVGPASNRRILDWMDRHAAACYDLAGVVDIAAEGTTYRWDADVAGYKPRSANVVLVYRRRSSDTCSAAG